MTPPATTWKVPYFELVLGDEERRAVLEVIDSNWLTTGPRIAAFEAAFVAALRAPDARALAVANGTVALHLALVALGIGPGDEVICPSLTFVADANAIRYAGATPVLADVCSDDEWNLDPEDVERRITPRTRAILAVHYGGYPCRMDELLDLARRRGLRVVEDAAHGPLSEWRGQALGTIGDVGCFSFFGNKNMTTGEGGMVVTRLPEVAERMKVLRSHGMTSTTYDRFKGHAFAYDVTELGFNYRLDELRAALGLAQLQKLPAANARRRALVERYRRLLAERLPRLTTPFGGWDGAYGYHIFPVLLPAGYGDRSGLMARLAERGVQTSIHYRPIHDFTAYRDLGVQLPVTDRIAPRILSLPLFPTLADAQMDLVLGALAEAL